MCVDEIDRGGRWFAARCLSFVSPTDKAVEDTGRRDEAMHNNKNARKTVLGWTDEKGESGFDQLRSPWYSGETNSAAWWRWRSGSSEEVASSWCGFL